MNPQCPGRQILSGYCNGYQLFHCRITKVTCALPTAKYVVRAFPVAMQIQNLSSGEKMRFAIPPLNHSAAGQLNYQRELQDADTRRFCSWASIPDC
jgi:hypothetical protein